MSSRLGGGDAQRWEHGYILFQIMLVVSKVRHAADVRRACVKNDFYPSQ